MRRIGQLVLLVALGIALVYLGLKVGQALTDPGAARRLADPGKLQEVQLADGSVYVGALVGEEGDYLRLAGPAIIQSDQGQGGQQGQLVVQLMAAEPRSIAGELLIPRDQVLYLGNVTSGSGLETAYRQATGQLPRPSGPSTTAGPGGSPGATP
jgi:hypothetical protein